MQPVASPFEPTFRDFLEALDKECLICSPYITMGPAQRLIRAASRKGVQRSLSARIITDLSASNVVSGATDPRALLAIAEHIKNTRIVYLPRVHAKVYLSDASFAIVGSANFTDGGMVANLEYGFVTTDRPVVQAIRRDMDEYAELGAEVSHDQLLRIRDRAESARAAVHEEQRSVKRKLRRLSQELFERTEDDLLRVRVQGRTINAIFSDTIRYLLARRPMTTIELHRQLQRLHPDLCDDTRDRVIDGEHFGKLWKHQVRNAQQHLKHAGLLAYDPGTRVWSCTTP